MKLRLVFVVSAMATTGIGLAAPANRGRSRHLQVVSSDPWFPTVTSRYKQTGHGNGASTTSRCGIAASGG
jgi:hypothetical protein